MAKKKQKNKKALKPRKKITREKNPNFMVQISDPKNVRRNLLESLREMIIFMQGNEAFRTVQAEKVTIITELREDIKEINALLNNKLRHLLPKGKLKHLSEEEYYHNKDTEEEKNELQPEKVISIKQSKTNSNLPPTVNTGDELTNLENQLKDIETQLRTIN